VRLEFEVDYAPGSSGSMRFGGTGVQLEDDAITQSHWFVLHARCAL